MQNNVVIVNASRTAVGSLGKSLKNISAENLGSELISSIIKNSNIKKEEIEGYLFDDPHKSRYFFAPTATPIGSGNSYIRNTWLFF